MSSVPTNSQYKRKNYIIMILLIRKEKKIKLEKKKNKNIINCRIRNNTIFFFI